MTKIHHINYYYNYYYNFFTLFKNQFFKTKNILYNIKNSIIFLILLCIIIIYLIYISIITIKSFINSFININNNTEYFIDNESGINRSGQILFINLDNRKDRLESITNQFKNQNVNMNKVHRINAHYTPGNGHYGCAKSHLDAMKYAQEKGFDNVIVFEDDFKFTTSTKKTNEMFDNLFNKLKETEWDVVMLTEMYGKNEKSQYQFLNKITDAQTASGYVVNKHYYHKLIDVFQKCVDNMTQEKTNGVNWEQWALDQAWKVNQKEDKWFVFTPLMGEQDNKLVSTIQTITNYNI
jgi:GR25 family glycosyltransferase involved in LPS biosynthesis